MLYPCVRILQSAELPLIIRINKTKSACLGNGKKKADHSVKSAINAKC